MLSLGLLPLPGPSASLNGILGSGFWTDPIIIVGDSIIQLKMSPSVFLLLLVAGLLPAARCDEVITTPAAPQDPAESLTPSYQFSVNMFDFALNLYRQLASDSNSTNIFFSPLSISSAFALLSLGARSATQTQILEGLGFNLTRISEAEIHKSFQDKVRSLTRADREFQLDMGSALFVDNKLKLLERFLEDAKNLYSSEAFSTDFNDPVAAEKQINDYVEKATHGKIMELVKDLDLQTLLVVVNFISLKVKWEKPFDEENTKEGDFFVDEKTTVRVPMMQRLGMYNFMYDRELSCHVVLMQYVGNASAYFVLPQQGKTKQVEDKLSKDRILNWLESLQRRSLNLVLPKFSISSTYQLEKILGKLGMTDVFSNKADLSGLTDQVHLKVSKAVHKAMLNVDEKGTEAAAATAVEVMPLSLPPTVVYNHPFLVIIFDKNTQTTLFMGKIVNPTAP
ncbi:alpha-1-antitrypsin-like [Tachyglossus aculeatus]|uniref:alpha-1-antitrypsin-like n=1 Tax=Tachyglossus aculeatus TaxID=9261 RepID=UPI0018F3A625|nr:alpha-1-antitrypsin-like [Tachyglossus aculeatus]